MHLIFLTSRIPYPPNRGDRLRTYQFLRLFAREHAVTLVSFIAHQKERLLAEELAQYCKEIHLIYLPAWKSSASVAQNVWRDLPFQTLYYRSRQMAQTVDNLLLLNSFDMAYVHLFRMAPYLMDHPELYRILDLTDLISFEIRSSLPYQTTPWRTLYRLEEPRIARYEQRVASHFNEVWFISKRDRDLFAKGRQQAHLQVVPSAIDENFFLIDGASSADDASSDASRLLFVGHLDVKHNIDAARYMAEEIMPIVLREVPESELLIVGAGNGHKVLELDHLPGVRVAGYVPDLQDVISGSAISVAPLRFSAGIQFKVVEAMAAGLPVVTTSSVSAGLGTEPGRDLLVADSANDFARQVISLLTDKGLRRRLGHAGRVYVQTHITLQAAIDRLRAIEDLIA